MTVFVRGYDSGCCEATAPSSNTCFFITVHLGGDSLLGSDSASLSRRDMGQRGLLGLGNLLGGLGENELNVGRRRLVGVDSTVGSVGSSSLLGGLVDLDVRDDKSLLVKTLGLGVGLGVLEQVLDKLDGLDGPSGLGDTKLLTLAGSANGAGVLSEGNGSLVVGDLVQVGQGLLQVPASDGSGNLVGVLERGSQVGASGRGGLGGVDGLNGVSGHDVGLSILAGKVDRAGKTQVLSAVDHARLRVGRIQSGKRRT